MICRGAGQAGHTPGTGDLPTNGQEAPGIRSWLPGISARRIFGWEPRVRWAGQRRSFAPPPRYRDWSAAPATGPADVHIEPAGPAVFTCPFKGDGWAEIDKLQLASYVLIGPYGAGERMGGVVGAHLPPLN